MHASTYFQSLRGLFDDTSGSVAAKVRRTRWAFDFDTKAPWVLTLAVTLFFSILFAVRSEVRTKVFAVDELIPRHILASDGVVVTTDRG
jgi:hypothetical protein